MTEKEVFKEITSELKWYIGYCSQPYASQLIVRFNNGNLKQETIHNLFKHFGYIIQSDIVWKKSDGKPNNIKTK